ncbi:unnamed protein product [Allacma fusca]|uniref:Peptidase S1 domain-containing protein n=1 Tax=Allacma fusca TaxID=39272 RepID=A0A8J2JP25_9HEXA|nr:unnamed protein product [Allacma fusca]
MKLCSILLISGFFAFGTCGRGFMQDQNTLDFTELNRDEFPILEDLRGLERSAVVHPRPPPYLVSIQMKFSNDAYYHYCTGVILDPMTIGTSTKCVNPQDRIMPKYLKVVAGKKLKSRGFEQVRSVHMVYTHPKFNKYGDYDLAMLVLKTPLNFNDMVNFVRLPSSDDEPLSGACKLAGWSSVPNFYGLDQTSIKYHEEQLPLISVKECAQIYEVVPMKITDRMICAGGHKNKYYLEDQGAPLVCDGVVIGIASNRVWPKNLQFASLGLPIHQLSNWTSFPWVFSNVAAA